MKNIFAQAPIMVLKTSILFLTLYLLQSPFEGQAQEKLTQDTLECHIVGFNVGTIFPGKNGSKVTFPDGSTSQAGTMHSLYGGAWLNFGLEGLYKYKTDWIVGLGGDLFFGDDNLQKRVERMPDVYSDDVYPIVIGTNGTDAVVTCYNRGLDLKLSLARIFRVIPNNPNSGILAKVGAGIMEQQTIFTLNNEQASQLTGDYAYLYDHQRLGYTLTEGVGFWFMSNRLNLINTYVTFEVTQCWSHSTRDYMIDDYLGIRGKDNNRYFDLFYSLKFSWMFPLKGKTTFDYYYY